MKLYNTRNLIWVLRRRQETGRLGSPISAAAYEKVEEEMRTIERKIKNKDRAILIITLMSLTYIIVDLI